MHGAGNLPQELRHGNHDVLVRFQFRASYLPRPSLPWNRNRRDMATEGVSPERQNIRQALQNRAQAIFNTSPCHEIHVAQKTGHRPFGFAVILPEAWSPVPDQGRLSSSVEQGCKAEDPVKESALSWKRNYPVRRKISRVRLPMSNGNS